MIDFEIDTRDLSENYGLTREELDDMMEISVKKVTEAFARHWDTEAKLNLRSTRKEYRTAIQIGQQGRFTGIAYLNPAATLANWIEIGHSSFDMKTGFLKSPKVTQGKNGPYLTIPFHFATPGSEGESTLFAGVMPSDIHAAVLSSERAGERSLGMSRIGSQHHIPQSASLRRQLRESGRAFDQMNTNSKATSIYEGLRRSKKGSGYVNFRRVSLKSDADSWIHPGFSAKNLADKALKTLDIAHEVDMAIDGFLANLGFV